MKRNNTTRLLTKYVMLFIVILILFAGCLPVSSPVNVITSTEPVIATTTSTPTADIMGSDGAGQGWAVLAERNNYDGLNMQNLPMDYIDILQMHRLLLDMGWQESHIHEIREFGRNDLVQELDWLAENAGPDDLVFVYVIAHGRYLRDIVRWSSFFGREWAEIPSHRQILLVDSCKAAEFTNAISMWGDPEPFISIAGVDADEYGWAGVEEEGLPILGSIFTHYFALAFKDPQADVNSDGRVSVQEAVRLAEAQQRTYMHDVVLAVPTFVVGYHDLNFYPEKDPGFPHVVLKDTVGKPVFLQLDRRKTTYYTATPPKTPTPTFPALSSYGELVRQFDYDPSAPLDVQIISENQLYGMTIQTIQFTGANGKPVTALLVIPPGEGPFAGMLYLHWGQGDKCEFRSEAIEMASYGVVSLLIDANWHRPDYGALTGDEEITGIIIDLRRGVDLLQARSDVDPGRIGFVGHSYGAVRGGILAGVEKRIKAFVLMAGWAFPSRYDTIGSSFRLDGFHYIGHAAPSPVLFQFAHVDQYISQDMADEYYAAASQPKEIRWYNSSHSFTSRTARDERISWLVKQLELNAP